jgi:hypothetical protein
LKSAQRRRNMTGRCEEFSFPRPLLKQPQSSNKQNLSGFLTDDSVTDIETHGTKCCFNVSRVITVNRLAIKTSMNVLSGDEEEEVTNCRRIQPIMHKVPACELEIWTKLSHTFV